MQLSQSFRFFSNLKNRFFNIKEDKLVTIYDANIIDNFKKFSNDKTVIIDKGNNLIYKNYTDFLLYNKNLKQKKIISISPGGLQGFYLIGIVDYIKKNYNLNQYLFTGASAGAWASLLFSFKGNVKRLIKTILDEMTKNEIRSLFEAQLYFKRSLLKNYKAKDFDLSKTFIGVTVLKNLELSTNIFYNFDDLEDAIDCCIASSHIPFLTGGFINKYNNEISFDGGFRNSPYLDLNNTVLHINPNIWDIRMHLMINLDEILNKHFEDVDIYELYYNGYIDTKNNKKKLDNIFINNF
tara:strand:- start:866 stop:1750 length:885 start_codon:yes stop_codon:yes gene_type:complete